MQVSIDPDLLFVIEQVESFFIQGKHRSHMPQFDYVKFWNELSNPRTASCYLAVLISKLLAVETGDETNPLHVVVRMITNKEYDNLESDRDVKLMDEPKNSEIRQILLGTIYFVSLYYPFDGQFPCLRNAVMRWLKLRGRSPKTIDFVDECIRMLAPTYLEAAEGIISLVEQCSNIEFPSDFRIEAAPLGRIAPCLINTYLRNCLRQGKQTQIIFDKLLLFLKHPLLIVEPRLLSLLHMLRTFITTSTSVSPEFLQQAIDLVKNYYLWPKPYGDVAAELLQLLAVEMKSPGAAMRAKFLEENPELEKGYDPTGKEKVVHMVVDQTGVSRSGLVVRELINSQIPDEVNLQQVQLNLLSNILETNLKIDCDFLGLEYCSRADTASFYYAAIQILDEAILMNEKDASEFRIQKFSVLKDYIVSRATASRRASVAIFNRSKTNNPPPLSYEFLPIGKEEVSNSKYPGDPSILTSTSSSSDLTSLGSAGMGSPNSGTPTPSSTSGTFTGVMPSNWPVTGVGCIDPQPLSYVTKNQYPVTKTTGVVKYILKQYSYFSDRPRPSIVKIGVVGDDRTIHEVVRSYVGLLVSEPELFRNVRLRIYIIPVDGKCALATFLSRHDGWYGRHVQCVTNYVLRVYPSISIKGTEAFVSPQSGMVNNNYSYGGTYENGDNSGPGASREKSGTVIGGSDGFRPARDGSTHSFRNISEQAAEIARIGSAIVPPTGQTNIPAGLNRSQSVSGGMGGQSALGRSSIALDGGLARALSQAKQPIKPPNPGSVLRTELTNYFREARQIVSVKLYQCECWTGATSGNSSGTPEYFTIPFCQNVIVGVDPFTKAFSALTGMGKEMSVREIRNTYTKSFKFVPPVLSLKFTQMNVNGIVRPGPEQEWRSYERVVLSNVPGIGGGGEMLGTAPNPTSGWLEMYALDADSKKRKQRSDEHFYHISSITIEADKKKTLPFHVLIDGVLYGPFVKIKVDQCIHNQKQISLPVMSYFPLDL